MDDGSMEIVERSGSRAGRAHPLAHGEHVIGRGAGVSISLDDPDVSRHHARLEVDADGVVVEDLGSKNGIFVRGSRVVERVRLGHGDTFAIGELTFEINHPASRVSRMLMQAGEPTVTRLHAPDDEAGREGGLLLPLLGIALFGGLVAALLLL
jgi:pSer/pThr/pTyr-binding forkhead associated (FHA) protein